MLNKSLKLIKREATEETLTRVYVIVGGKKIVLEIPILEELRQSFMYYDPENIFGPSQTELARIEQIVSQVKEELARRNKKSHNFKGIENIGIENIALRHHLPYDASKELIFLKI